ncbi:hypothetical protein PF001_g1593 [Phytophthora fragariae]|uniref:Integrase catalytic domain-containing protein n=1 Tax=Phytophthora fragariae TaxID=53985 RepID=A0A6A4F4K7_9STRA|nr:hypothetical protein PF003_g32338 [Phytophthora fragariae]KAE8948501.1 hypothetical protein PF009_g1927 [Phytophthora fragariae]KAE9154725.1 hypothetical protein PF006_g1260 [Phytophthora fragariae]KAE9328049.1 hypothetical protein PF001_g1593 [Phytophthora fragariae]
MDYLELGESYSTSNYVLVLKDELTHYCELVAADSATSATAAAAVLDWHKRFGLPEMWESDNGSHFKAALMQQLADRLKVVQKFVPVYTPWINGTVERVNRDILHVLRLMLMELNLDTRKWPYLLPLIQANLNDSAVASLEGHAPIELFTGLPAPSLLDTVVVPVGRVTRTLSVDMSAAASHLVQLRQHLAEVHAKVIARKEQRRAYELAKAKGQTCGAASCSCAGLAPSESLRHCSTRLSRPTSSLVTSLRCMAHGLSTTVTLTSVLLPRSASMSCRRGSCLAFASLWTIVSSPLLKSGNSWWRGAASRTWKTRGSRLPPSAATSLLLSHGKWSPWTLQSLPLRFSEWTVNFNVNQVKFTSRARD